MMHPNLADELAHVIFTEQGIPGKGGDHRSKNRRLYVKKNGPVTSISMSREVELGSRLTL